MEKGDEKFCFEIVRLEKDFAIIFLNLEVHIYLTFAYNPRGEGGGKFAKYEILRKKRSQFFALLRSYFSYFFAHMDLKFALGEV